MKTESISDNPKNAVLFTFSVYFLCWEFTLQHHMSSFTLSAVAVELEPVLHSFYLCPIFILISIQIIDLLGYCTVISNIVSF